MHSITGGRDLNASCSGCAHHGLCVEISETGRQPCLRRIDLGAADELPLPPRRNSLPSVLAVVEGSLQSLRALADGRQSVTAFHLAGELIHLSKGRRGAIRHRALVDARICELQVSDEETGDVAVSVFQSAVNRIEFSERHIASLGKHDPREKVACFLVELAERQHGRAQVSGDVSLPMSRLDVADYLGLQPETVSRALGILEAEGLIRRKGWGAIKVENGEALSARAAFD